MPAVDDRPNHKGSWGASLAYLKQGEYCNVGSKKGHAVGRLYQSMSCLIERNL